MRYGIEVHKIFGRVRVVEEEGQYRVREVAVGEDLRVRRVGVGPKKVGQWEIVNHGEDFTVQFVGVGEHFTIRFVNVDEGENPVHAMRRLAALEPPPEATDDA